MGSSILNIYLENKWCFKYVENREIAIGSCMEAGRQETKGIHSRAV